MNKIEDEVLLNEKSQELLSNDEKNIKEAQEETNQISGEDLLSKNAKDVPSIGEATKEAEKIHDDNIVYENKNLRANNESHVKLVKKETDLGEKNETKIKSHKKDDEPAIKKKFYDGIDKETIDTITYRAGYPDQKDKKNLNKNYEFYTGQIESEPDGDFLKNILKDWKGDYDLLEAHHGYIQWLFPIREQGLNSDSHALQLHELTRLLNTGDFIRHLKGSYELMLDFYGMKMKNNETGELGRAENYKARFANLSRHMHNNLRITRILKCLGEFNLESYQIELIHFLAHEIFVTKQLDRLASSFKRFWIHLIKNDERRHQMINHVKEIIDNL